MRHALVWDLPTRVFHWALAALVVIAYLTAEDEGIAYEIHVAAGYGIGLLVIFRIIWGMIGSRHARFADFARSLSDLRAYVRDLARLRVTRYIGHNPLGTCMVLLMLATLTAVLLTGLYGGEDLHEFLGELIVILAVIHVAGVLADSLFTRENLVLAMITGRKTVSDTEAQHEPGPPAAWRTVTAVVLTALIAVAITSQSTTVTWPPPAQVEDDDEDHDNSDD